MADLIGHRHESEVNIGSTSQTLPINKGGGGDTSEGNASATAEDATPSPNPSISAVSGSPSSNGLAKPPSQQHNDLKSSPTTLSKDTSSQKDGLEFAPNLKSCLTMETPLSHLGPNELFFGATDRTSGASYKDREERVRQLRERQQQERQQKLEELKEQAAAAQRFREQQETVRRQRLDEMRSKDSARRTQVEERKRLIQQAEQERRQAVLRKSAEREHRLELKRRQERSNAVFAFGSSTPRMLDPRENIQNYFGTRRATSTTNVNLSDSSSSVRRASEGQETDLSRKRATSAHSLNRKPDDPAESGGEREPLREPQGAPAPPSAAAAKPHRDVVADLRMSTSMYEVFNWDDADGDTCKSPLQPHSSRPGEDASTTRPLVAPPPPTAARRRTDLLPAFPSLRDSAAPSSKGSPRHRSPGVHSGTVTPGSPSRPTSALSQTSSGSQAILRSRTSPRKPRPFSIAGSTFSSADKPTEAASTATPASLASPNRESRPIVRKSSSGSNTPKPARAKSAGSDRSGPSTPAKTSRGTTPKRTPAQVKAENAAKKATERSKHTTKSRSTPKTTPLQSPTESKSLPLSEKKNVTKLIPSKELKREDKPKNGTSEALPDKLASQTEEMQHPDTIALADEAEKPEPTATITTTINKDLEHQPSATQAATDSEQFPCKEILQESDMQPSHRNGTHEPEDTIEEMDIDQKDEKVDKNPVLAPTQLVERVPSSQQPLQLQLSTEGKEEDEKSQGVLMAQRATEKPVTGYASEEDYKAALAEKRRQAREAKEREIELERQRQEEEEARERQEEEEYLRLMEEQKEAENERLKKAILEAERQREEEATRKEEEERQRLEAEKIEHQKKLEAEEKMKKEEEERQMRKSRVAAIMSRTRGKISICTPSKSESKTPDENKTLNESLMSSSMTENILNNISSSMTDSMIAETIESHKAHKNSSVSPPPTSVKSETPPLHPPQSTRLPNESEGTALSTRSSQLLGNTESSATLVSDQITTTVTESVVVVEESHHSSEEMIVSDLPPTDPLQGTQVNGDAALPVPMDTTPSSQSMDLLGSFNGLNGIGHNGVDSGSFHTTERPDNQFGSLDPFNTSPQTILTTSSEAKSDSSSFDQIIDLNQTKLTNEDAVNSNPPPPFIAFEDNLNKKSQSQDPSSNVPDLLL